MDQESITQSKVGPKQKNKYHILTYVCQIQESGTEAPLCGAGTEKQVWRRGVCVQGEAGWDELGG